MNGIELPRSSSHEESPDDRSRRFRIETVWPHGVWAAGLLILCGIWTVCGWRMIDVQDRRHEAQLQLSRQFHSNLIREMQVLSGQNVLSTTDDLCRIRFRLRLPEGLSEPSRQYTINLAYQRKPDLTRFNFQPIIEDDTKIADFGLLPPGDYQLTMEDDLGMRCDHAFQVHPGIPIDRVAYCPDYQTWMFDNSLSSFELQFDWPAVWESEPIAAVVHLRSADIQVGEWTWQPPAEQQFEACVLVTNSGTSLSWERVRDALPSLLTETAGLLPAEITPRGGHLVTVPYGCCEVSGISFVTSREASCVHLGTFLYTSTDVALAALPPEVVLIAQQCPRQVRSRQQAPLPVSFPHVAIPTVLHRVRLQSPGGA